MIQKGFVCLATTGASFKGKGSTVIGYLEVPVTVGKAVGDISLPNVKCWIMDAAMETALIGQPELTRLGIDPKRALEKLIERERAEEQQMEYTIAKSLLTAKSDSPEVCTETENVYRNVRSRYTSPVLVVPKPDGRGYRMIVGLRAVNSDVEPVSRPWGAWQEEILSFIIDKGSTHRQESFKVQQMRWHAFRRACKRPWAIIFTKSYCYG